MALRLALVAQLSDEGCTRWMLLALGGGEASALKMAAAIDCASCAFDARRGGKSCAARQLLDARLNELCRRHRRLRNAVRQAE